MVVNNKKWDEERFFKERKKALALWPTGKEVDIDEAVEYHKKMPDHKNFHKVMTRLHNEGRSVVFPRAGTPILGHEIALNKALVEAGLPLIPVTPDSFCRLARFDKAQEGLELSIKTGEPKLNGFPTVIHGVKNCRKLVEETEAALNQRLTNIGGIRLMAEIAFASGMTAALADPILSFGWYESNSTISENIEHYQYVHRLIGYYAERGVTLSMDIDGIATNLQFPQDINIAGVIAVALIAAEQGVKSMIPAQLIYGNLAQDVAYCRVCRRLVREYLDRFGFKDVATPGQEVSQVPLFPYPQDMGQAFGFLVYSAIVAALAKGEMIYLRTTDEAAGIPTAEAHAMSYRAAKFAFDVVRAQGFDIFDNGEVKEEEEVAEKASRAIIERILELGDGDVVVGLERACQNGMFDLPLCGNKNVKNQVLGVRDARGACRYLDFGNIP
ncbi:MAG: hypothetical protein Q7J12_00370, partial [Syntrophales bacterium]|nr:hypothetical protein [Syntrophales bacterium]